MKKLFSTSYSSASFNIALLVLRVGFGVLMVHGGYYKLTHIDEILNRGFMSFIGLSPKISLYLLIFAEFFCAGLVVIGLFTRLATIPLIISGFVALIKAHDSDVFGAGQPITLYIIAWIVILLLGAGKISVDGMVGK